MSSLDDRCKPVLVSYREPQLVVSIKTQIHICCDIAWKNSSLIYLTKYLLPISFFHRHIREFQKHLDSLLKRDISYLVRHYFYQILLQLFYYHVMNHRNVTYQCQGYVNYKTLFFNILSALKYSNCLRVSKSPKQRKLLSSPSSANSSLPPIYFPKSQLFIYF